MLGSDYPLVLGENHPGQMIESIEDMDDTTKVISCRTMRYIQDVRLVFWNFWCQRCESFVHVSLTEAIVTGHLAFSIYHFSDF